MSNENKHLSMWINVTKDYAGNEFLTGFSCVKHLISSEGFKRFNELFGNGDRFHLNFEKL